MITMVVDRKNTWIAISLSLIFHIFLLLAFVLLKVKWYELPTFTEITFITTEMDQSSLDSELQPIEPPVSINAKDKNEQQVVKLPLRKMLEPEPPQLRVFDQKNKLDSKDEPTIIKEKNLVNHHKLSDYLSTSPSITQKETAPLNKIFLQNDKPIPSGAPIRLNDSGSSLPYAIEGAVAQRSVVYKIIPDYPENLQKEAVIKIRFTVLPDGKVGEMIPIIRADAKLEKITLDALRQWRFNPLPKNQSPRTETGVITFRYLLK